MSTPTSSREPVVASDIESSIKEVYPIYNEKSRPPFLVYFKYDKELENRELKSLSLLEDSRRLVKAGIPFKQITKYARNVWKVTQ